MKILFIDTWSKGSYFTNPIAELAKNKGHTVGFLHANKLYDVEDTNWQKGLYQFSYDCANFHNSLVSALQNIKPDAVVFISMHGIFHRWANYICCKLNIPCFFFMHGVRFNTKKVGGVRGKNILELSKRGLFYTNHWRLFIKDCLRLTSVFKIPWCLFLFSYHEMIFRNNRFNFSPRYKWGSTYNKVFINTHTDEDFFKEFLGESKPEKFIVSGNITSRRAAIGSLDFKNKKQNTILFISQPLASAGYINSQSYIGLILSLRDFVKKHDLGEFVVRLHPRDDEMTSQALSDKRINVSNNESFAKDLSTSSVVVGFNSSSLLGCVEIGIPVIGFVFDDIPLLDSLKGHKLYREIDFLSENSSDRVKEFIEIGKKQRSLPKNLLSSEEIILNGILRSERPIA